MDTLKIQLFGGLAVWLGDQLVDFPTQKIKSLFAYLVTHRDRAHPRDVLIGQFWGESPEAKANSSLRYALSVLRKALGAVLIAQATSVRFNEARHHWLDVEEFGKLIKKSQGLPKGSAERTQCLQEAVGLYQGVAGFYDDWVLFEQERLKDLYLDALRELADFYKAQQDYAQAVLYLKQIQRSSPSSEEVYRELMYLYAVMGDRAAALRQYEACRRALKEMKLEPLPETRLLYERIKAASEELKRWRPAELIRRYPELTVPFVGRSRELEALIELWADVCKRQGRFAFIEGEVGIGKTRLAHELMSYVQTQGGLILSGSCHGIGGMPYQPLIDALRSNLTASDQKQLKKLQELPAVWLAEIVKLVPELRERFTRTIKPNPSLGPEQDRSRLFEGLTQCILHLTKDRPLLLFLDDLHRADEATLQYLSYLSRRVKDKRILVISTHRVEELEESRLLTDLIGQLLRQGVAQKLTLEQLFFTDTKKLIHRLLKLEGKKLDFFEDFTQQLYDETEGNPLFIVELIKSLIEAGVLKQEEQGRWHLTIGRISEEHIPRSLREGIAMRLRRLSKFERRLLELAAVAGREFEPKLLLRADSQSEDQILEMLDDLRRAYLIIEKDGKFGFHHELFRQVLYEGISQARRRHLHLKVAKALEAQYGERTDEVAAELAHHFYEAQEWPKALEYFIKAGECAKAAYANQAALDFFRKALELTEASGLRHRRPWIKEKQLEILMQRVDLYSRLGHRQEEKEDIAKVMRLAAQLKDKVRLSEAYFVDANYWILVSDYPAAERAALKALAVSREAEDKSKEALALNALGIAYHGLGQYHKTIEHFERAYQIHSEIGDQLGQGNSLNNIGIMACRLGRYDYALTCYQQAYQIAKAMRDKHKQASRLSNLGELYHRVGKYDIALNYLAKAYNLCLRVIDRNLEASILLNIGEVHQELGDWDQVRESYVKASDVAEEIEDRTRTALAALGLAEAYHHLHYNHRALDFLGQAQEIAQALGRKDIEVKSLSCRCLILLNQGRKIEALQASRRALELLGKWGQIESPWEVYFRHSNALLANARTEEAKRYLQKAYKAIMKVAAALKDPAMRESFLKNKKANREIIEAWESKS